jgi:hypothetical protein
VARDDRVVRVAVLPNARRYAERYRRPPQVLEVTFCDLKFSNSGRVSWNTKSARNLSRSKITICDLIRDGSIGPRGPKWE